MSRPGSHNDDHTVPADVSARVELARSLTGLEALSYSGLKPTPTPLSTRLFVVLGPTFALLYAIGVLVVSAGSADVGFNAMHGSQIVDVYPASPAAAAGLRSGDVVVSINGVKPADAAHRWRLLHSLEPGIAANFVVQRGGQRVVIAPFKPATNIPIGSALTTILGLALLLVALYAGRGRWHGHPKTFLRSTVVYVVFLSGLYSLADILGSVYLGTPWIIATVLAAPMTCHFMMKFPAGLDDIGAGRLLALYGPPALLGIPIVIYQVAFALGSQLPGHSELMPRALAGVGVQAGIYLGIGGYLRLTRVRRKIDAIDPAAAKWLKINSACVALPFVGGLFWVFFDRNGFLSSGFRLLATATVIAGSFCLLMAMARVPFGQLDRYWRRSSGYVVAIFVAAGVFLGLIGIGILGGGSSSLTGDEFRAALAATIAAAVIFGPLRGQVQHFIDARIGRNRKRARGLLREAAEAATATLDVGVLQSGVVHRVRSALAAKGVAIYVAGGQHGSWCREAWAGYSPLPKTVAGEIVRTLESALAARMPRVIEGETLAIPLPIGDGVNAAIVVAPREGTSLDDEERDLLRAAAAGLVVAVGNARAHTALQDLTERLKRQVDVAEKRRREIARLKERVEEENRALIGELASRRGHAPVIGLGLKPTFELVQKVARTESSVLVRGETGVGKELVARALHAGSPRRDGPLIVVDCGAISAGLIESTLFGHLRGAFTGAVRDSVGAFRAADGGTIFLDEIGELPPELQPKLLRFLQERVVQPVGSTEAVAVDVRVVSGTNRDLANEVELGNFRRDLLYRLQVVEVIVPPLRQRLGDIEALAEHFLAHIAARSGQAQKTLAPDAVALLLDHDWPGNVRELEHTLEAAAVYAEGAEIAATDLPISEKVFRRKGRDAIASEAPAILEGGAPRTGLRETLEHLERDRLLEALAEQQGNKSATARVLGMSRGALLRRLKRYEIREEQRV